MSRIVCTEEAAKVRGGKKRETGQLDYSNPNKTAGKTTRQMHTYHSSPKLQPSHRPSHPTKKGEGRDILQGTNAPHSLL